MGTRFAGVRQWFRKLPYRVPFVVLGYFIDVQLAPYIPFFPIRLLVDAAVVFAVAIVVGILLALILPNPYRREQGAVARHDE